MIASNTQNAIIGDSSEFREQARQQVIAITRLRANLHAVAEHWQAAVKTLQATKARE